MFRGLARFHHRSLNSLAALRAMTLSSRVSNRIARPGLASLSATLAHLLTGDWSAGHRAEPSATLRPPTSSSVWAHHASLPLAHTVSLIRHMTCLEGTRSLIGPSTRSATGCEATSHSRRNVRSRDRPLISPNTYTTPGAAERGAVERAVGLRGK